MIVIVDYGMGNLRSVQKKFDRINANSIISAKVEDILSADKLVLPGVGHFANGVKKLKEYGLWEALNKRVLEDKVPILGICLGMQLMALHSEEGNVDGLGWLDAQVIRFRMDETIRFKVPHMGWNHVSREKDSCLFENVPENAQFYFVHSYYMKCNHGLDVLSETNYHTDFTSAVQKGNIYGTQFHPEKSHEWGEQMLVNFTKS
ncbi:MAG: imidazole glycerol phosphate synthase subunit HisH [Bacteroidales bacterium]|nr:imidazole glycerol phosphate synthase subunit HisH [Bacteroidales bacterium]